MFDFFFFFIYIHLANHVVIFYSNEKSNKVLRTGCV